MLDVGFRVLFNRRLIDETPPDEVFANANMLFPRSRGGGCALPFAAPARPGTAAGHGRESGAFRVEPGRLLVVVGAAIPGGALDGLSGPRRANGVLRGPAGASDRSCRRGTDESRRFPVWTARDQRV